MLRLLFFSISMLTLCDAIFFGMGGGGGGGGCCCGCGTPQPPSCGCAPACPQAPACPVCPPPQPCPAPPAAYCPQVQPVYVQSSGGCGGCGGGNGNSYASSGGSSGGSYIRSPVSIPSTAYSGPSIPLSTGYSGGASNGGYSGSGSSSSGGYSSGGSSSGGEYSSGGGSGGGGGGSGGGGYAGGAAAAGATAAQVDEATETGGEPSVDQIFHSPKEPCTQQIKYIMLKSKKVPGTDSTELVEEELEQVRNQPHVEATANPLDTQLGEEIAAQEQAATEEIGDGDDESAANSGDFKARAAKTAVTDEKCNSTILQKLVLSNIAANDALTSKKAIHENALQQFPDSSVDVICSTTGFTYLVSTTEHCEAQKDGVICFVYKRPL
ncbi:hypothetical protein CAEBREN_26351 [Caenorhabditis brenneri]|uniref:Ground-like domain-containing protein n=1 Tax=Caenorhabditis brenneri TaxID=135651 RepID=G0MSF4_CAEBE|nr:hypothetical protein CAEBREN_26351 [Caenorhabditis brenneri]